MKVTLKAVRVYGSLDSPSEDIAEFTKFKNIRDALSHGQKKDFSQLKVQSVQNLLKKYLSKVIHTIVHGR
ncbi:MAG: hypothetical protein HQK96_17315 [Nitrospirae bacterium]|nr:hypothetical protein [Nitrospirota bacterium]